METPKDPGMRSFGVQAATRAGIAGLVSFLLALATAAPAMADVPLVPPSPPVLDSITLLSPEAVSLSRSGVAQVPLVCSGGRNCNGTLSLETLRPLRNGTRRRGSLGSLRFAVPAQGRATVGLRLAQRDARGIRRAGTVRVAVAVEELDLAGRIRRSSIKTRLVARRG